MPQEGFISLPNFIEFSFKPVYPNIGEFFKFSMFRLLENAFFSQKIESSNF